MFAQVIEGLTKGVSPSPSSIARTSEVSAAFRATRATRRHMVSEGRGGSECIRAPKMLGNRSLARTMSDGTPLADGASGR